MPTMVHVGPISSPGGIQTVIGTLSSNPPDGWTLETIESHSSGSYLSKLQAYNNAKKRLEELANQSNDGLIVHLHAASDYSFLRKLRLAEHAHRHGGKIVFHIHSGNIVSWLGKKDRAKKLKQRLENCKATIVCLSERWKELITPFLGKCIVSPNPIDPMHSVDASVERNPNQILLLGRNDPIKGHDSAFQIMNELKQRGSDLTLVQEERKHQKGRQTSSHLDGLRKKRRLNCCRSLQSFSFHQPTKGSRWLPSKHWLVERRCLHPMRFIHSLMPSIDPMKKRWRAGRMQ